MEFGIWNGEKTVRSKERAVKADQASLEASPWQATPLNSPSEFHGAGRRRRSDDRRQMNRRIGESERKTKQEMTTTKTQRAVSGDQ